MEVIPAIDLRGGQVVRLQQGDYARETVYDADPAAVAKRLAGSGARRLHVVDLDAARDGNPGNEAAIRSILQEAGSLRVQIGGGIRSRERIEACLELGADRVIMGTAAVQSPALLRQAVRQFPGRIILGLDARDGIVAIHGWRRSADRRVEELLDEVEGLDLAAILYTDIGRDGMLSGPNLDATEKLARRTPIPVLASGGVGSLDDLMALARTRVIAGVVVGKAIYSGAIDLEHALAELDRC